MWHEARRQGKKITGMLVDYRKRAERRRDYYESNKADPTQFLQIHGRQCKIHLDPNMATSAEKAIMMYWQDILVDRFDVRVHLGNIGGNVTIIIKSFFTFQGGYRSEHVCI